MLCDHNEWIWWEGTQWAAFLLPADFLADFLVADFLADFLDGVAEADEVWAGAAWAAATGVAFFETLLVALVDFFAIFLEPVAFLVTLFATFLAPAGLALAIGNTLILINETRNKEQHNNFNQLVHIRITYQYSHSIQNKLLQWKINEYYLACDGHAN